MLAGDGGGGGGMPVDDAPAELLAAAELLPVEVVLPC